MLGVYSNIEVSGIYLQEHSMDLRVLEHSSIPCTYTGYTHRVLMRKFQEYSSLECVLEYAGVGYLFVRTFKSVVCVGIFKCCLVFVFWNIQVFGIQHTG